MNKMTVREISNACICELVRLGNYKYLNNNEKKQYRKITLAQRIVDSLPDNIVLADIRLYTKDRDFALPNVGDVTELAVGWHTYKENEKPTELSLSKIAEDLRRGAIAYDVKASLESNALNTPFKEGKKTADGKGISILLVNKDGVQVINRECLHEYGKYVDYESKQGWLLPASGVQGKHDNKLEAKIGAW